MYRAVPAVSVITCLFGGCDYHGRSDPDGGPTDGAVDAGGSGIATCGKPGAILDDFADGVAGYQWRVVSSQYGDIAEAAGDLVLSPMGGPAGYTAIATVDLRDASLEVELPTMVATSTMATASFTVRGRGKTIGFTQQMGTLSAVIDRLTDRLANDVPYDPVAHRWWRIADVGGTVALSTSPDGVHWAPVLTGGNVGYTEAVAVSLHADATDVGSVPGAVTFRNLRATEQWTPVGRAPWCKAAAFSDRFDADELAPAWTALANPASTCDPHLAGGKLHVDQPGPACLGTISSASLYDLTDSAVVLEVDPIATVPYEWVGALTVSDPVQPQVKVALEANNSQLCSMIGDYDYQCTSYTGQRYWRVRGDAGSIAWESSPDRVDWTLLRTAFAGFDLARVRITVGTYRSYDSSPAVEFASPGLNP